MFVCASLFVVRDHVAPAPNRIARRIICMCIAKCNICVTLRAGPNLVEVEFYMQFSGVLAIVGAWSFVEGSAVLQLQPRRRDSQAQGDMDGEERDMEESPPGDIQELESGGDRRSGGERE